MSHKKSAKLARKAADQLRKAFKFEYNDPARQPRIGIVLGTGWGDALGLKVEHRIRFEDIKGFPKLDEIEGHAREVVYGTLNGLPVIALRGRVHLNERPASKKIYRAVRLQIEMLLRLGVQQFILTCAAGSLREKVEVGDLVLIESFYMSNAPDMPGFAAEFRSPTETIDLAWISRLHQNRDMGLKSGTHAMLRGPFFESVADKRALAKLGCDVVGMSVLPEACIAALYDVPILPVAFVTNTVSEKHSHEENGRRAKAAAAKLGAFLERAVALRHSR